MIKLYQLMAHATRLDNLMAYREGVKIKLSFPRI